jgi:hypothetical protein
MGSLMSADDLAKTKQLMGALIRQPPKPHDEMKLGRNKRVAESKRNDSTARKKGGRRPSSLKCD